jgi:hypothetical protein
MLVARRECNEQTLTRMQGRVSPKARSAARGDAQASSQINDCPRQNSAYRPSLHNAKLLASREEFCYFPTAETTESRKE